MPKLLLRPFILLILFTPFISKAGTIRGMVRDTKGEPLPFATVFIKGTTTGTAANALGEYQLGITPGTYTLICQFISYKQAAASITITGAETVTKDFRLESQNFEIGEVRVTGNEEDPAYRIMRKVLARRSFHLDQVKAFQASIYLKGVLRTSSTPDKVLGKKIDAADKVEMGVDTTGKGVLYLCEEVADYYAQQPDRQRTVIHSVRQSGNPRGLGFSQIPPVISFYENNVNLGDGLNPRGFVSPLADGALGFYRYELQGEYTEDQHIIYKIRVTPKRAYEPLFDGFVYIVADDWAIHSLSLTTTGKLGMDFLDSLRINQVFLPLKHDTWVIKNQLYYPVLGVLGFGITGNFVTVYDNQKVNEPVPDTIFNKKIVSQYDKDAAKHDTAYWEETRPIPLEADEANDYRLKDSLARRDTSFAYTDSIRKKDNRKLGLGNILVSGKTFNSKAYRQSFGFGGLLFAVNYNTVEGFNAAPQLLYTHQLDTGNSIRFRTALRYGFENGHINPVAALSFAHRQRNWRSRGWTATLIGGSYVYQFNPDNPTLPLFNTYTTLVSGENNLKLYERREITPLYSYNGGNGFRWTARLSYQDRIPLENALAFAISNGKEAKETPNYPEVLEPRFPKMPQHKAMIARIGISYQPGFKYIMLPEGRRPVPSDAPVFSLTYTKGISDILDSKVDYDKWRLGLAGDIRLRLAGSLSYTLAAGGFLNHASVFAPDLMHLYEGDDHFFTIAPTYLKGFQLAKFYKYSNAEPIYGEAHVEYNLNGLLTNKIPLLKQAKWYLIVGSNAFYANKDLNLTEVFVSLDNIGFKLYRFFRFDYVQAWEANGRSYHGIRVGLRGIRFNRGGDDTEW